VVVKIGIYGIKNISNGKLYVGQSKNINKRNDGELRDLKNNRFHKRKHQKISNHHLQSSFNKYGEDNFIFTIIKECHESELDYWETYYIKELGVMDPSKGYNEAEGARKPPVFKGPHKQSSKDKISEETKGENNAMATLTQNEVDEIVFDLKSGDYITREIADKFNKSLDIINRINNGSAWFNEDFDYPLNEKLCTSKGENNGNAVLTQADVDEIIILLESDNYNTVEIGNKFNINSGAIQNINTGKGWFNEELNYPINKNLTKDRSSDAPRAPLEEPVVKFIKLTGLRKDKYGLNRELVNLLNALDYKVTESQFAGCKNNKSFKNINLLEDVI
jgi:group I intron endonuclease